MRTKELVVVANLIPVNIPSGQETSLIYMEIRIRWNWWAHRILVSMADGLEGDRPQAEDKKRRAAMPNRPERRLEPLGDNVRKWGTVFNSVAPGTGFNGSLRRAATGD